MEAFRILKSQAVLLLRDNIDTDQISPSRYAILPRKADMAEGLFRNLRDEEPDFPLNDPRVRHHRVLVTGDNFGCGSSRESAVWALVGYGFRAVIAGSFGDIFRNNAVKNGLLLVEFTQQQHREIVSLLKAQPELEITIDLPAKVLSVAKSTFSFPLESFSHELLVQGHDELEYLLRRKEEIDRYEVARRTPRDATGARG